MVHSMVICAHSTVLADAFAPQRAPYPTLNMMDFESDSVKRVIDWMYSGEIEIPEATIADVLAVVSYLRVATLQRQIEQKIQSHSGSPVLGLNIASARPYSVMDDTMDRLVHNLAGKVAVLSAEEVSKLTVNSVIAVMAAVLPMAKKVPLINMFILWIKTKNPEKETINKIIQSLVISDITYDTLYSIRYSLKQYLTNPEVASKSQLSISPSGTIDIKISTRKNPISEKSVSSPSVVPQQQFHRTVSEIVDIEKIPDPFGRAPNPVDYRTISEIEDIRMIPDPFDKSVNRTQSNNNVLRRETNNGFPKYFTRSEVENFQKMTDQFGRSEKENFPRDQFRSSDPVYAFSSTKCTAKYPGWSNEIIENNKAAAARQNLIKAKFTPSEAQMVRQMPDPFVQSEPVILRPAVGNTVSSARDAIVCGNPSNQFGKNGANQSFSGHSLNNNNSYIITKNQNVRPSPVLSVMSSTSGNGLARSVVSNPTMVGPRKTPSEIREINALPSLNPSTYHTAKSSNSGNMNTAKGPAEQGQKSQKTQKIREFFHGNCSSNYYFFAERSQYLYPN
uniref:BTB domain-containing protein n=1 Tax=Caenorhabditis tropicalis TaxID=1561998 RepID=A0A1I7T7J1_9PELO